MEESLAIPSISQMAAENIRSIFMAISSRNGEIFQIRSLFKGYPLVMTNIAIENGHRNSGFSH